MSLFGNYSQPGRGIPKAPMEKKGIFKFFEIYGRRFWKLLKLNLLYILFCLPVITFGPATAAMTKIARNYSQERNAFMFSDFVETFKKCFKQSFIIGIIDLIFTIGFIVAIPAYMNWAELNKIMYIPLILCISCFLVFFMMHFYIYQMIVSTNLTLRQILKNSFFLVSLGVKNTAWTFLVWIVVLFILLFLFPYSLFIIPFFPFSFLCFVTSFNCYPIIRKHVIQPYYDARGEENPESNFMNSKPEEAVFEDRLELESAPKKQDKRKGKTIS